MGLDRRTPPSASSLITFWLPMGSRAGYSGIRVPLVCNRAPDISGQGESSNGTQHLLTEES